MQAERPAATDASDGRLALAELMATRLCHDLAGLCGTLGQSLELAVEDRENAEEALGLAQDSARELTQRLRLVREAWGEPGEAMDRSRLQDFAAGLPGARRITLNLSGLDGGAELSPELGRVLLNALLLGAEGLAMGGTLAASGDTAGLEVSIAGPKAAWPRSFVALLEKPFGAAEAASRAGPRGLQAPLLVLMAESAGFGLRLLDNPKGPPVLRIGKS